MPPYATYESGRDAYTLKLTLLYSAVAVVAVALVYLTSGELAGHTPSAPERCRMTTWSPLPELLGRTCRVASPSRAVGSVSLDTSSPNSCSWLAIWLALSVNV